MKQIGINGGTFDPIHFGHLKPAYEVMQNLGLDEVRFIPACQPVLGKIPLASAQQRCEMTALAIQNIDGFVLDDIEVKRSGPSFMVDTLSALQTCFPNDSLVLMLGADVFNDFSRWHQYEKILTLANLVIMGRPGAVLSEQGIERELWEARKVVQFSAKTGQIMKQDVSLIDLSSTEIKQNIQQNNLGADSLPQVVEDYINQIHLYERQTNE